MSVLTKESAKAIKLSNNFTLWEFVRSSKAIELELMQNQLSIGNAEKANLKLLCKHVLQPLRDYLGVAVHITSGYRSYTLNWGIGGSLNSDHCKGKASDIVTADMDKALAYIRDNCEYDQLIDEYKWKPKIQKWVRWLHVSYRHNENRKMCFEMRNGRVVENV